MLVVLGHPNKGSFNHAIARTAVQTLEHDGHEVIFHDLYEEKFDPILRLEEMGKGAPSDPVLQKHCNEITSADGIMVVHPNWWGQPPACLKGWLDRVIRAGVCYEFMEIGGGLGQPNGLLKARAALVLNTSNTPQERELKIFGDPLDRTWRACIFSLCGVSNFHRKLYAPVIISTPEQRQIWLDDVRQTVSSCFPPGN